MSLRASTLTFVHRPVDDFGNRAEPLQLDAGQALTADAEVDRDHVGRLIAAGVLVSDAVEPSDEGKPAKLPTVEETLAYVGDDVAKATEMLELERAQGDSARKTLVASLEAMLVDRED